MTKRRGGNYNDNNDNSRNQYDNISIEDLLNAADDFLQQLINSQASPILRLYAAVKLGLEDAVRNILITGVNPNDLETLPFNSNDPYQNFTTIIAESSHIQNSETRNNITELLLQSGAKPTYKRAKENNKLKGDIGLMQRTFGGAVKTIAPKDHQKQIKTEASKQKKGSKKDKKVMYGAGKDLKKLMKKQYKEEYKPYSRKYKTDKQLLSFYLKILYHPLLSEKSGIKEILINSFEKLSLSLQGGLKKDMLRRFGINQDQALNFLSPIEDVLTTIINRSQGNTSTSTSTSTFPGTAHHLNDEDKKDMKDNEQNNYNMAFLQKYELNNGLDLTHQTNRNTLMIIFQTLTDPEELIFDINSCSDEIQQPILSLARSYIEVLDTDHGIDTSQMDIREAVAVAFDLRNRERSAPSPSTSTTYTSTSKPHNNNHNNSR